MLKSLTVVLAWSLFLVALLLTLAGLFTAVMAPAWIDWQYRLLITGTVGERGYRWLWLPVAIGAVAWLLRRRHPAVSIATLGCCVASFGLLLTPVAQARWLGQKLPARLAAAFGPAAPDRPPFSPKMLFAPMPAPVPVEEMTFGGPLQLDFFRAVGRTPAPCVIVLHGGGWVSGGHRDRRPYAFWLARHGYAVATIDYRLVPQAVWPVQRWDVRGAIDFLRAHAVGLGVDPQRIVLLGRSAGAQLAEATAYAGRDPGIRGVIAFYGPSDLRVHQNAIYDRRFRLKGWTAEEILTKYLGGTFAQVPAAYDSASGLVLAGPASPPTLLIHGRLDSLVPVGQSELLAAKLTAAGRPNLLLEIPWASHGFDTTNFDSPGTQLSTYAIDWFLAAVTR